MSLERLLARLRRPPPEEPARAGAEKPAGEPLRWGEIVTRHALDTLAREMRAVGATPDQIEAVVREREAPGRARTMDPFAHVEEWLRDQIRDPLKCRSVIARTTHALQQRRPRCPPIPEGVVDEAPGNGTAAWRAFDNGVALLWKRNGHCFAAVNNPLSLGLMRELESLTGGQAVWLRTLSKPLEDSRPVETGRIEGAGAGEGRRRLFKWLREAYESPGVSDLHMLVPITPGRHVGHVYFRQHGQIKKPLPSVPLEKFLQVQQALLSYTDRSTEEGDYATFDKQIVFTTDSGKSISGRLSMVPYNHGGEHIYYSTSIRLLNAQQEPMRLPQIVGPFDRARAQNLLDVDSGLVIVSGPTGSGKSTLLATLLSTLYIERSGRRLLTVEDPVEIRIPGAQQFEVREVQKLTFKKILKSLLRQDPDIVLVGEIRDEEVADIAVNLALTGQTVYATVHANYATTVGARMRRLKVHPDDLAMTLRRTTSQRLLTGSCPECAPTKPLAEYASQSSVPGSYRQLHESLLQFTRDVLNDPASQLYAQPDFRLPDLIIHTPPPHPDCPACHGLPAKRRLVLEELSWTDLVHGGPGVPETEWWEEAIIHGGLQPMWFRAAALLLKRRISVESFFDHFASYPPQVGRMKAESRNRMGMAMMVESGILTSPEHQSPLRVLPLDPAAPDRPGPAQWHKQAHPGTLREVA